MIYNFIRLIIVVATIHTTATATAPVPDYWHIKGVKPNDTLSIRTQPNHKSKKIGEIPHDARCIQNLTRNDLRCGGYKNGWCKVAYGYVAGWVSDKYLEPAWINGGDSLEDDPKCFK